MSEMELQFTCPSCASVSGIDKGDYIQCRHCGNKYQKKIKELLEGRVYTDLSHAVEARQEADFDTARDKYDALINRYQGGLGTEEAYWGKLLCEQYVIFYQNEDGESIPSFWEINDTSCLKSESYKKALEYGEKSGNRENYERLAKLIESYKQKYRAVQKAEPDGSQIFICFKDSGTNNAQLGYDLYNQLSRNYRVFFSKESLKTLAGNDYEPKIYHAMRTAKVMIVLCSAREHLDSQWVKNEWWRFAKFCENDSTQQKTIIPIIMDGFSTALLPKALKHCQYINYDHNLMRDLFKRIRSIFDRDQAQITVQMNDFEKDLRMAEEDWNAGKIDEARIRVDHLLKENIDKPNNHVTALLLQAKIFSNGYKNLKDERAVAIWAQAEQDAKKNAIDLHAKDEYRRYRKKVTGRRVRNGILVALLVLLLAAGTVGIIFAVQDPMVDMYVTGKPQTVEIEYGANYLDTIPSITTLSKKGKEKVVELNPSMVSGFDPTKMGMQTITISYEEMTIEITVNVIKYTLAAPGGFSLTDGRITWTDDPRAESYTVQINDEVFSGISTNYYEGNLFTKVGVYSVRVKAIANAEVGKDSSFSEYFSVACLSEASNLKLDGTTLSWDPVSGGTGYDIYLNETKITTTATNSYTVPADRFVSGKNLFYVIPVGAYNIKAVNTLSGNEALDYEHNGELVRYKFDRVGGVSFADGALSWGPVPGATKYQVYINNAMIAEFSEPTCGLDVTKLIAGDNLIYVIPVGACNLVEMADPNADFAGLGAINVKKLASVSGISLNSASLTWNAVEGATQYEVYMNGVVVATTSETYYNIPSGDDVENAQFDVRALGGAGVIPSDVADGESFAKLPTPTGIAINSAGVLSWSAVSGATGYEIYLGDTLFEKVSAAVTSFDLVGKVSRGTHQLSVLAVGDGGSLLSSNRSAKVEYVAQETLVYISTETDLRQMLQDQSGISESDRSHMTYVLENDITITDQWTPVGVTANPFVGKFEGNGKTIYGLTLTATSAQGTGFFGVIDEKGVVKNVTFRNVTISGGSNNNVGTVAGINRGTIYNVNVYGTVSSDGNYLGGIAGRTYGSIYSCENHASVTGKRYVGGITGKSDANSYDMLIHSCKNDGTIVGTDDVGGIIGVLAISKKMTVYGMVNTGNVTASGQRAGGIFGQVSGASGQIGTVESCSNSGAITASDYAGGCFGQIGSYITVVKNQINDPTKNCVNTGTVSVLEGTNYDQIGVQR